MRMGAAAAKDNPEKCRSCQIRFSVTKKKHRCSECSRCFCSACVSSVPSKHSVRHCGQCRVVLSMNFTLDDIKPYTAKELVKFLQCWGADTRGCVEKADFQGLMLQFTTNSEFREQEMNQKRHVEELKRRAQQEPEWRDNKRRSSLGEAQTQQDAGPSTTADQPPGPSDQPPGPSNQPPGPSDQPPGTSNQPPGTSDEPPGTSSQPPGTSNQLPGTSNQPPGTSDEPPGTSIQLSHQQSISDTQPAMSPGMTTGFLSEGPPSTPVPQREGPPSTPVPSYEEVTGASGDTSSSISPPRRTDVQPNEATDGADRVRTQPVQTTAHTSFLRLSDLTSRERIKTLTNRELRTVLATSYVNFRGVVERDELIRKVELLWDAQQHSQDLTDEETCRVCMDRHMDCVLLDCGHMVTCTECGKQLSECPICRQFVVKVLRVFKA